MIKPYFSLLNVLIFICISGAMNYAHADCLEQYGLKVNKQAAWSDKKEYQVILDVLLILRQSNLKESIPSLEIFTSKFLRKIRKEHGAQLTYDKNSIYLSDDQVLLVLDWLNKEGILCPNNQAIKYEKIIKGFPMMWKEYLLRTQSSTPAVFLSRLPKDFSAIKDGKYDKILLNFLAKNIQIFLDLSPTLSDVTALLSLLKDADRYDFHFELKRESIKRGLLQTPEEFLLLAMHLKPRKAKANGKFNVLWNEFILSQLDFFLSLKPTLDQVMQLHDRSAQQSWAYPELCLALKAKGLTLIRSGKDFNTLLKPVSLRPSLEEINYLSLLRNDALEEYLKDPQVMLENLIVIDAKWKFLPTIAKELKQRITELREIAKKEYAEIVQKRAAYTFVSLKKMLSAALLDSSSSMLNRFTIEIPSPLWLGDNLMVSYPDALTVPSLAFDSELPCAVCNLVDRDIETTICKNCLLHYSQEAVKNQEYPLVHPLENDRWISAQEIISSGLSEHEFNVWQNQTLLYMFRNHRQWQACAASDCIHGSLIDKEQGEYKCDACDAITCSSCQAAHPQGDCARHQQMIKSQKDFDRWLSKAKSNSKHCPYQDCGVITQKNGGCDHMICKNCERDWHWTQGQWTRELTNNYPHPSTLGAYARSL